MATTAQNIFNKAISIIDELSDTGSVSDSQVREYKNRAPYLLDLFQKEMIQRGDLFKTFEFTLTKKKNLLDDANNCGIIVENNGETKEYSAVGANCFYLEVDGDCTISFKEDGQLIGGSYSFNGGAENAFVSNINITVPSGTTSFLPIRGILNPLSQSSTITMSITGQYYFRHNNRALASYKYNSALKVPNFTPWIKIEMPSDFKSRSQIVNEYAPWCYEKSTVHRWEGNKDLYVQNTYEGIIRIQYIPVPTEITSLNQTMEIDDITATAGAYYLAEHFAISDMNSELAAMCSRKYREIKAEIKINQPLSAVDIIDVYGFDY